MIAIMNSPVERTRFLKFMAVGAFGAVVDFGIANVLSHFFNMPLVYAGNDLLHLRRHQQLHLEPLLDLSRIALATGWRTS